MNETTAWLLAHAEARAAARPAYADRAFYVALAAFIRAQALRLEQAEGELDGRSWDHRKW